MWSKTTTSWSCGSADALCKVLRSQATLLMVQIYSSFSIIFSNLNSSNLCFVFSKSASSSVLFLWNSLEHFSKLTCGQPVAWRLVISNFIIWEKLSLLIKCCTDYRGWDQCAPGGGGGGHKLVCNSNKNGKKYCNSNKNHVTRLGRLFVFLRSALCGLYL